MTRFLFIPPLGQSAFAPMVGLVIGLTLFAGGAAVAEEGERTVSVTGRGEVSVAPDMAIISVGVAEDADEARVALNEMTRSAAAVIARIEAAGVASEDLQTGALQLSPRYGTSSLSGYSQIEGYQASTTLTVRVRDLPELGTILDAVVTDGANQLSGLRFDVADREPLLNEARQAAVADARSKAELYATAAGVSLGPVLVIAENAGFGGGPEPVMMMEARSSGPVPVAAGEITISATISMTYGIVD